MGQLATAPRTLLTSCRLLILRRFHFSNKRRHDYIQRLPLLVKFRNYLEFSDFCAPDYGQHFGLQSPQGDTCLPKQMSPDDSDDDDFDDDEFSSDQMSSDDTGREESYSQQSRLLTQYDEFWPW
ncbi:hypothetical protein ACOMHN_030957 [Nucella lapillus]